MFKKLDKLIVKAFVGPFIATFFITLLVLVMQFFWLYIDDFVGKGLSPAVILEFIWYQSAVLVPLSLPLAVLISSLMTFGNLGETFELVAIKSAGISLLRFMRPLFFITFLISGVAFLFSNYVIPVANLKSRTLLGDIYYAKPAFDLKEGVFYDRIDGFAMKIGKKENDSIIKNVIIYEAGSPLQDNFIIAESGVMRITPDHRYLEMDLRNGWRYEERGNRNEKTTDFIRIGFKEFNKQFDISTLIFRQTADSVNKNNQKMLNMRQLQKVIDSLEKKEKRFGTAGFTQSFSGLQFVRYLDSGWTKFSSDTLKEAKNFMDLLPDSARLTVSREAASRLSGLRANNNSALVEYEVLNKDLRLHKIEWHRKISLSLACVVLFLIGAPLGSIIRKGGVGTPLVFAIVFFMIFYFSSTTGEKLAKEATFSPFSGMWLSTFVLVPMGVFLIYKALRDSQLFNKEFYYRILRRFRKAKPKQELNEVKKDPA
ncbi:MAG: LptF/LptG family permease [Bacteroidetes bacterium]|nr:LptF/LptG family permease [Bacteroidota bacterium]MBS1607362.1 LptF/LptG family permease [Bacteroidota bacterium]